MSNLKNDLRKATDQMASVLHAMAVDACKEQNPWEVFFLMKQFNAVSQIERQISRRTISADASLA